MHTIEPFYRWKSIYDPALDSRSPYFGKEYNPNLYSDTIYGYYIDPYWDEIGSETLYLKILFADYDKSFIIIELMGEWNDALHNDVMYLKRNIIDHFITFGINKYILIGENVMNFHGSDDCYYEEWFEDIDDGWVAAVNFQPFVSSEMSKYNVDNYINFGENLNIENWRTMKPIHFFSYIHEILTKRLT